MDVRDVAADLAAEQQALDDALSDVAAERWTEPTSSPRWNVADQIAHLAYFDRTAAIAITDPDAFGAEVASLLGAIGDGGDEAVDALTLGPYRDKAPSDLLTAWRVARRTLADAAATLADDTRVVWYGPSMGARSFLTARLMEAWAHGQDVVDALAIDRPATDRLAHIAQLGFITRGWTYKNRGLDAPTSTIRVELLSPSGAAWTFGPDDADETVTGSALDFCLVVTQRRHVDDTDLVAGPDGRDWLLKAQAFAGPPTDGPISVAGAAGAAT